MKSIKRISSVAGTLILLGILFGLFSIAPAVEGENFLQQAFPNENQVLTAGIFQFLLVPIYIGFALLLYPILRMHNKTLALGFVGFRFMSATFQTIGVIPVTFVCSFQQRIYPGRYFYIIYVYHHR